jgi:GntR family transcriptional regulator
MMSKEFTSAQPIYLQLVSRICKQIVRGEVSPGDKLPSVREMAIESGVNPNTVSRVYAELERMEVAEARRGQGTFVTENISRLNQLRAELRHEQIQSFVNDMHEMGFSDDEVLSGLMDYLKSGGSK